jgi:anti-anti-sigma regulatory factor
MTELYIPAPDGPGSSTSIPTSIPTTATVDVRPVDAAHGVIITVSGPLMRDGVDLVREHLDAELDRRRQVIVLDLSAVPSCDPAGTDVLARARDRARHEGLSLHLVHLGAPAARAWMASAGL